MAVTLNESLLLQALRRTTSMLKSFPLQSGFDHTHFCQFCWAPTSENQVGEPLPRQHRSNCSLNNLVLEAEKTVARVEGRSETKQG